MSFTLIAFIIRMVVKILMVIEKLQKKLCLIVGMINTKDPLRYISEYDDLGANNTNYSR